MVPTAIRPSNTPAGPGTGEVGPLGSPSPPPPIGPPPGGEDDELVPVPVPEPEPDEEVVPVGKPVVVWGFPPPFPPA